MLARRTTKRAPEFKTSALSIDFWLRSLLQVEIHEELVWMRAQPQGVILFLLQFDPVIDEVLREDVAFQEELVILFKCFHGSQKGIRNSRHLGEFIRWKLVEVLVEGIARVNTILNSI